MGDVTIPHTFTNGPGNVIDATQVNANFVALRDAVNDLTIDNLASALRDLLVPTGALLPFGGSAAPSGFLLADGSVVSRTTYAALFAVVGTANNTGGEAGTDFRLPDLRGRVPVGVDGAAGRITGADALGNAAGAESHALTVAQMPVHAHNPGSLTANAHAHSPSSGRFVTANGTVTVTGATTGGASVPGGLGGGGTATTFSDITSTDTAGPTPISGVSAVNGSGDAHNNMQPYQIVNYIIKT